MSLIDINNNMMVNFEYSIEFFQISDYSFYESDPTMMKNNSWLKFLDKLEDDDNDDYNTLQVPLKSINQFDKTQKIWFRDNKMFDKVVVELDNSLDNNIIEFIEKSITYKTITLNDMKKLGCIVYLTYINNNGNQVKDRLFVGRPEVNTYTNSKLSITVNQMNKILTGSDFETNVIKSPTASSYNYISLVQAFGNIYNLPHNVKDRKAYPATPFRLNEEVFNVGDGKGITLTDGNIPDGARMYAEDKVAGTDKDFHCQFYYKLNEPACAFKMSYYGTDGEFVSSETVEVMDWNVWNNTQDAITKAEESGPGYHVEAITNYQRYFRPFKVVIAGQEEADALAGGNYRVKRNYIQEYSYDLSNPDYQELDFDFYQPYVQTNLYRQLKILPGDLDVCEPDDVLVYFEILGDVRYRHPENDVPSANVLYDSYAQVHVYNLTKDIVYFDHITNFVQTTPLPQQWLSMNQFIGTERIVYASGLNYDSTNNQARNWLSFVKPMCAVHDGDGGESYYGNRFYVASGEEIIGSSVKRLGSFREGTNADGVGGTAVGEKMYLAWSFGRYDLTVAADLKSVEDTLDWIQDNQYPKSIRISDDGKKIYFLKPQEAEFTEWLPDWEPRRTTTNDYSYTTDFATFFKWAGKTLHHTRNNGSTGTNLREYDWKSYYVFNEFVDSGVPMVTELSDGLVDNSVLLANNTSLNFDGSATTGHCYVAKLSTSVLTDSDYLLISTDESIKSINIYKNGSEYAWCLDNKIYLSLVLRYAFASSWKILDYNSYYNTIIAQTTSDLIYYDIDTTSTEYSKPLLGFEYLLPMDRDRMLFTNTIEFKNDELIALVLQEDYAVRLLSFSGNRYLAGDRLACSFIKNTFYDGDGVLNIGMTPKKFDLTDYEVISNSKKSYKYDTIEYYPNNIEKNVFKQLENTDATSPEEEELTYDESISINMYSNKDVQMDITVTRTSATEITWKAYNDFNTKNPDGTGGEGDTVTIDTGFNFFTIALNGIFDGITITCNFYNTDLGVGEKFRGTIERRLLSSNITADELVDGDEDFPFLDDQSLGMQFPFLYSLDQEKFFDLMEDYFLDNLSIRQQISFTVTVPTLLMFDSNYNVFDVGSIVTLKSESKTVYGYELDVVTNEITPYNENKNDYYIEKISYNIKEGTTKLSLISV